MKLGIAFANVGPFTDPDNLAHLAQTAESVGVESIWSVEHVVVPIGYESEYPYDKSGKIPGGEQAPIPDPLLPLAFVAGVTKTIRLGTGILILPQRHPAYVAKEVATLDVLSRGRAILGIGVGWLREEFDTVDVEFETRGSRTRESVRAIAVHAPRVHPDGSQAHVAERLGDNGADRRRDRFAGGSSEITPQVSISVVIGPSVEFVAGAERSPGPRLFPQASGEVGAQIRPYGAGAGMTTTVVEWLVKTPPRDGIE